MGIKNLNTIIKRYAPNSITNRRISDYTNKKIAIDLSIYLYKFLYNNGNHISGLVKQISQLLKYRILPIYILDGKPPKEKSYTLLERRKHKNNIKTKIEILNAIKNNDDIICENMSESLEKSISEYKEMDNTELDNEIMKHNKRLITINNTHIEECKELFDLMGIPYIIAEGEAEILCAQMTKYGYADACLSEDTDMLPNGATFFLKGLSKNRVTEYSFDKVLSELNMTNDMFIDMCILCGCDYTGTIKGIGPINAYYLIHKYKSIEDIIQYEVPTNNKYKINNFKYENARDIFKNNRYTNIEIYSNMHRSTPSNQLNNFIKSKTDFNTNFIKNFNKILYKHIRINKQHTNTIDNYFVTNTLKQINTIDNYFIPKINTSIQTNTIDNYFTLSNIK
jgi:flap endonuclease-1